MTIDVAPQHNVDKLFLTDRFSSVVDFGACLGGKNLNVLTFRGYGKLDELAAISGPDVYDQLENPNGTQRTLNNKHAKECLLYAVDAVDLPGAESPRFFPEILLNARDAGIVELYDLKEPERTFPIDSFTDADEWGGGLVGMRVLLGKMIIPKPSAGPQISRVDGNHRLYGADEALQNAARDGGDVEVDEFPVVPFALLVGLEAGHEAALFRDINGEHRGMEVAHLAQLTVRTHTREELQQDPALIALWIADELGKEGHAFEGMVFRGGSQTGVKKAFGGGVPPIKLSSLKTTIAHQLRAAPEVATMLKDSPEALLSILDNYWKAVRTTQPEAWHDKSKYILLSTIGLHGFAKYGGTVLDRAFDDQKVSESDFEKFLAPTKKLDLSKEVWRGVAGAGGAQRVFDALIEVSHDKAVVAEFVKEQLLGAESLDAKMGIKPEDEGNQPD